MSDRTMNTLYAALHELAQRVTKLENVLAAPAEVEHESPVEPAAARPAEAPEPDYRDGEQAANVVRVLEWARLTWGTKDFIGAAINEAIREVRAHDKARRHLMQHCAENVDRCAVADEVLALLDGEHAEENA